MATILAAFKTRETAETAVDQLMADGVAAGDIAILNKEGEATSEGAGDRLLGFPVVASRGLGTPIGSIAVYRDREGLTDEDMSYYTDQAESGAYIVAVRTDDALAARVRATLMTTGAHGPVWQKPV